MNDFRSEPDYLAERRRVIRDNHPDRGGSDAALIAALDELDEHWARKLQLRKQVRTHRPSFIPEDVATQAADTAGEYIDRISRATSGIRDRSGKIVANGFPEKLAQRAGRLAGNIRHTVTDRIPSEFLKGYRGDSHNNRHRRKPQ